MNNSWLQYPTTSNKVTSSYLQGFLSVSGNIILRNQGMNILNGDISANGNLYLTTNNFLQLQNDDIASYIQSGTVFSTGSASDIVMTGMQKTPEYMRIKGTTGYIGIKTTTPSHYLHVNGSSFFSVSPIMVGNNIYSGIYNNGKYNTSVGIKSLQQFSTNSNTNGINNSSFGFNSAYALISNNGHNFGNNSTFGVNSFLSNTSGYNNTIFGVSSSSGTQIIQDCIFGQSSGRYPSNFVANYYNANINVNNNIAFGRSCLVSTNNTSYDNICFGSNTYLNFGNNLKDNIFFGNNSGNACISSNNIVIVSNDTLPDNNTINTNIFNPINYADPLLWYESQDVTTLYNNAGNQTTVGGFIKTIKNKAPNYIGTNDLISMNAIGTTAMYSQKTIAGNVYLLVDLSNSTNGGFYTSGSPTMSSGFSCFCVCMTVTAVTSGKAFFLNKTNGNIPIPFDSYDTTRIFGNGVEFFIVGSNANPNAPFNFRNPTSVPQINYIEFDYENMNYNEYSDGTLIMKYNFNTKMKTGIAGNIPLIPVDNNTRPLYLFGRSGETTSNSVYLFEFVFFNKNIATQNRLLIEGYLAWKYKIQTKLPITHPYYSTQPTALSATTVMGMASNTNLNNNNISIGRSSLSSNKSGQNNVAVGAYALNSNTVGSFNSAVGVSTLYSNTSGNHNNAFGHDNFKNNTMGNYNNSIGYMTLFKNTTGNFNCAVGTYALYNNTIGNYNCAFGKDALSNRPISTLYDSTTSFNSVFGKESYVKNDGINNCVFGSRAFTNSTSGNNNTAIGSFALLNAFGNNNVALGHSSFTNNASASNSVVIGTYSGKGIISGETTIIGYNINSNTTNNTTGFSCVFGAEASKNSVKNTYCCVAGYQSSYYSNAVNQCVYGYKSGFNLTTSPNNVAMGPNSLYTLNYTAGTNGNNIAIGSNALYYCASGNYNISIGANSGLNTVINGKNIFIGNNAKLSSSDAWGNSVAIGHNATITDNNQVVLGTTTTTVYVLGSMRVMGNTFIRNSLISSDYRIKQNVIELDENHTTNILQPSSYLNVMTKNREFGFIADDIHEKYPVLTNEMGEEKLKYVNYNGITCISINDLKNLKKMIEKQKIKIANQKKEMENMLFDHCSFQPTEL